MPIRPFLAILLLAASAFAQEGSQLRSASMESNTTTIPQLEQLKAQIASLQKHVAVVETQLAVANQNLEICALPEVMRARLAAYDALQRAKPVETKPPAQPTK